ncbi:MAG TPA: hypothetical protein VHW00_21665 [Thermoanaerobaculia bacterium]|nr:hypothetical protein [Thermoanaerobaculia bacterium]
MLALVLFARLAAAAPAAEFRDRCHGFDFVAQSKSGDAMEDDMALSLLFGEQSLPLPLPPALYTPSHPLLNVKNLCTEITALDAGHDRVVLLFSRNARPQFSRLDAVLVDLAERRVLDVREDLGEIKGDGDVLVVRNGIDARNGFDVRLVQEWLPDSGCDCAEAAIEEWLHVAIEKERIATKWR